VPADRVPSTNHRHLGSPTLFSYGWFVVWLSLWSKAVHPSKPCSHSAHVRVCVCVCVCVCIYIYIYIYIYIHTGCNRRNGPDFGRVFLMLNYTEKPQNTYIQSSTLGR
jgi:hypothetical protein